jgi:hypothetical protein
MAFACSIDRGCCLTLRSSRAPTACHAGHQAQGLRPILRLLSSAPHRRCRLSSNVRLHEGQAPASYRFLRLCQLMKKSRIHGASKQVKTKYFAGSSGSFCRRGGFTGFRQALATKRAQPNPSVNARPNIKMPGPRGGASLSSTARARHFAVGLRVTSNVRPH